MGKVLTDDEAKYLVRVFLEARGDEGATEEEIKLVLDWGVEARVSAHLLSLVLSGRAQITVRDGNVIFYGDQ